MGNVAPSFFSASALFCASRPSLLQFANRRGALCLFDATFEHRVPFAVLLDSDASTFEFTCVNVAVRSCG